MASSIMRFINWLRISDQQFTPVDVVGRVHSEHDGRSAVALAEPVTKTKTAFYAVHQRKATREEIHTIFVTLDSLGFIAD